MPDSSFRKLENYVRLSPADRSEFKRLAATQIRRFPARTDIIHEGEAPVPVFLLVSDWACRYKQMVDGRGQIVAIVLPGDCCDLSSHALARMDHSIATITPAAVSVLTPEVLARMMATSHRLSQAMWWNSLVNIAVQREWTVSLGQRSAFERVAHLLCETFVRLRAVGLTNGDACEFPLTQADLADATGLSAVHANRTLQELRGARLIVLKDRTLMIPNLQALQDAALFDANYLHLGQEGRSLDANA